MRVLQAMSGAEHGGAEKFFVNLVLALSRAGLSQQVLIAPNSLQAKTLTDRGLHVTEIFGTPGDAHMRFRFLAAVAEFQPDIVLTWMTPHTLLSTLSIYVRHQEIHPCSAPGRILQSQEL